MGSGQNVSQEHKMNGEKEMKMESIAPKGANVNIRILSIGFRLTFHKG